MVIAAIRLAAEDAVVDGTPVALLPWGEGETLIEYQVAQLRAAGVDVVVVVLGSDAERIIPLVAQDNVEPIVNDRWAEGMAGTIRVGAAAIPRESEMALVARVDEPRVAEIYRRLIDECAGGTAAIARVSGGTPIVFGRALLAELRNVTGGSGLDALLARHAGAIVEVVLNDHAAMRIQDAPTYALARRSAGFE